MDRPQTAENPLAPVGIKNLPRVLEMVQTLPPERRACEAYDQYHAIASMHDLTSDWPYQFLCGADLLPKAWIGCRPGENPHLAGRGSRTWFHPQNVLMLDYIIRPGYYISAADETHLVRIGGQGYWDDDKKPLILIFQQPKMGWLTLAKEARKYLEEKKKQHS